MRGPFARRATQFQEVPVAAHCIACGSTLPDGAAFCPQCGAAQEPAAVRPQALRPAKAPVRRGFKTVVEEPEHELWRGRFSPKGMIDTWAVVTVLSVILPIGGFIATPPVIGWVLVALVVFALWLIATGWLLYQRLGTEYVLTDQRFLHTSGILTHQTRRIEVIDIDDVTTRQSLLQRMVGSGTMELLSSDVSDPLLVLSGIENVRDVAQRIDDARRRERIRRGIHIESV